ncbi:MAG: APC family permease [Actinomycetota bacterium]
MEDRSGETGYERLGAPKLSLIDVVAQSVGFMGPVFSAAFLIPLIVGANPSAKGAGIAAPLSVVLAAIGVFALGWIVAQYAKKIHAAGALYDYVSNGLGQNVGAASGWLYYGGTLILTTGLGVLIGGYVHDTLLPTLGVDGGILPIWLWNVVWAAALFLVLYLGVQISTRVQLTLALVSVAVVLLFVLKVIIDVGGDNDLAVVLKPGSSPDGWSGILFGVLYGVLIFVGFESAANLAEETTEPKRQIPRAVLGAVVTVSIFYLIVSYAYMAGFGFDLGNVFAAADAPLFALGSPESAGGFGSDLISKVLVIVVLLDILAVGVGAAVASTRGVFAMARDRRLPAPLASVSGHGTPLGAIVLLMAIQAVMISATELWESLFALPDTPHYFAVFAWAATFGGFALLVVYLLMSLGALRGLADHPNKSGLYVAVLLGVAITVAGIYGSFYKVTSPFLLAPWFALLWFVLGLVIMFVVKGRTPASQTLADLRSDREVYP